MAAPFSIEGYVKSVKVVNVGNYQKAYINVSSMRKRPDKEGNKQYDSLTIQCFVHGIPSYEEGSYIVANGEIQGYKDQNDVWQTVLFAENVGVEPQKFREPKDRPQVAGGYNGGASHTQQKQTAPKPQNTGGYQAPARQTSAPQNTGYSAPRQTYRTEEPKPVDPSTAQGPEFFDDQNIPF